MLLTVKALQGRECSLQMNTVSLITLLDPSQNTL
uniref:Uncharacterized protein n=1 Tax=Podarcis muralis TaxID=64176 RepID=A0A670KL77_PODMU